MCEASFNNSVSAKVKRTSYFKNYLIHESPHPSGSKGVEFVRLLASGVTSGGTA
jgi:hypothetical protein